MQFTPEHTLFIINWSSQEAHAVGKMLFSLKSIPLLNDVVDNCLTYFSTFPFSSCLFFPHPQCPKAKPLCPKSPFITTIAHYVAPVSNSLYPFLIFFYLIFLWHSFEPPPLWNLPLDFLHTCRLTFL